MTTQAAHPALSPGDVLASRYRLVGIVSSADVEAPALVWRATDEVLARPVAIKVLAVRGRWGSRAATPFLEAAGRASGLSHPGLARVYDAALEERPTQGSGSADVAYVVSEWVDGRGLAEILTTDGPLEPVEAVRLVQDAAEALALAHQRGVGHGRLHPGNLLVSPGGRLRVTDTAIAAALHGTPVPPAGPDGAVTPEVAERDTRDLAAALYAMLTARWPSGSTEQPSGGLPAAPRAAAGTALYAPRQVRAGVPRALDNVVVRALEPGRHPTLPPIRTPMALAQALDEVELRVAPETPSPRKAERHLPGWVRPALPKVAAVAVITAVGVIGYQSGKEVGELPRRPGALDALVASAPSAEPGTPAGTRIDLRKAPIQVRDYDPFSRDRTEQADAVPNVYDEDLSTVWTTDGYKTATFGGLKPGVGLLVDLGTPTALAGVQVGMTAGGAAVDLRATNTLGENADDFTVVARSKGSAQVATLTPTGKTPSRYWLVWFTSLPKADDGKYRLSVAELVFTRAG